MCLNEAQVSLSMLVQVNKAQLESHQSNQTEGGAKLQLYKTSCCTGQSVSTEESQNKLRNMMLFIQIFFCLFCGASVAAQELNWNIQPAAGRFGDHRPHKPEFQEPAGMPEPHHSNTHHFNI